MADQIEHYPSDAAAGLHPSTVANARGSLPAWLVREIDALSPGSFALVMATGIISNAFYFERPRALSDVLCAIALAAYLVLATATMLRALRNPRAVWRDLLDPHTVFSFFTIVAASDVLGAGLWLRGFGTVAVALWLFALLLWLGLIYTGFGVLTFRNSAHDADVIGGAWLIGIVGTQSLVVLGAAIARQFGNGAALAFVLVHILWGIGLVLYGIFITLFAQRIFFLHFTPEDVSPLLWVVMGAAAISANAGTALIASDSGLPFLQSMRGFIDGVTLITWAWATWWIPLLVLLGIWKHGIRRVPIRYTPMLWAMVFPLGMYALASLRLALAADVPALRTMSLVMAWLAFAVWLATAIGLAHATWRSWRAVAYQR